MYSFISLHIPLLNYLSYSVHSVSHLTFTELLKNKGQTLCSQLMLSQEASSERQTLIAILHKCYAKTFRKLLGGKGETTYPGFRGRGEVDQEKLLGA